ncbi:MAG: hypothetical protein KatS3mg105_2033 [Gemmatales bacterium]|nr:MAG: hypothetical protein KatS3mg105_2033 [Gemmatales bacterium]
MALGAFGFTVNAAAVARWSRKTSDALVPAGPLQERFGPFDGLYFNSRAELDAYVRARKGRLLAGEVGPARGTGLVEYDPRFAARQMGLDPEKFASLPPLRQQYVTSVYGLRYQGQALRQAGKSSEEIARILHAERRAIAIRFKDLTPPDKLAQIYARNLEKYGDKLGPTIEWLRGPGGKTWGQIIESASRAGGADLEF